MFINYNFWSLEEKSRTNFFYALWERIANCYSAHVHTSFNFEESLVTPSFTPWVFNDPVVFSVFISISNCKDCMINILWLILTSIRSVYTASVISKSWDNLESNWNWSMSVDCFFQFVFISLSDIYRSSFNSKSKCWFIYCAIIGYCKIWISYFCTNTSSSSDVFKCMRW